MFEQYLYLADEMAERYGSAYAIDKDDAIQEARMCLLDALDYDTKGHSFESYFWRFVPRIYLTHLFALFSPIYYPSTVVQDVRKGVKIIEDGSRKNSVRYFQNKRGYSDEKMEKVLDMAYLVKGVTEYEMIDDDMEIPSVYNTEDEYIKDATTLAIISVVRDICTEREADIILRKLGFFGEPDNFNELSEEYGICKQRVGQIYKRGIEKLSTYGAKTRFRHIIEGYVRR